MKGSGSRATPRSGRLVMNTPSPRRRSLMNRRSQQADVGDSQGSLRDVERAYVQQVLAKSATLREAAKRLGIDMATLWRKRKRWGLA